METNEKRIIRIGERFERNIDVINLVYGLNMKPIQTSVYKRLWFPFISEHSDWLNYFNEDRTVIYEKAKDPRTNLKKKSEYRNDPHKIRYVFVKNKIGSKTIITFVGIFQGVEWDYEKDAYMWKMLGRELTIPADINER